MRGIVIIAVASLLVIVASCSKSSTSKYKSISTHTTSMASALHSVTYYLPRITFYASSIDSVYDSYTLAQAHAGKIDICFVYDSVANKCYFVSPDSLASVHMPALTGATHSNIATAPLITQTVFNNIKNDSLLQLQSPTTTNAIVDTTDETYVLKNSAGKVGVMYGHVTAMDSVSYSGSFNVKVQQ